MPQYADIDALLRDAKGALSRADALSASVRGSAPVPAAPRRPAPVAEPQDDGLWGKIKRFGNVSYLPEDIGEQFTSTVDPQAERDRKAASGTYGWKDTAKSAAANVLGNFFGAVRQTNTPVGLATLPGGEGGMALRAAAGAGSAVLAGEGAETALDSSQSKGTRAFGALQALLGAIGMHGAMRGSVHPPARTGAGARGEFSPFDAVEPPPPPPPPPPSPVPLSSFAGDGRAQPIAESIAPRQGLQVERYPPNTSAAPHSAPQSYPELLEILSAPDPVPHVAPEVPQPSPRYTPFAELPDAPAPMTETSQAGPGLADWLKKYSGVADGPGAPPEMATRHTLGHGALPEGAEPRASFLAHQDDFNGGSIPLYNVEGGVRGGSTVSAETLAELGIPVPETPPFTPRAAAPPKPKLAADEVSAMLTGRQKFADANPGITPPPGVTDELDRAGVEYGRTQRELKRLLGMPDADPAEVARMQQGARELGSRLRKTAKGAATPPPPPAAPPSTLEEMLIASIAEQDAARATRDAATPPAPRGEHFRLPETKVPDEAYNKIRDHLGVPPSPIARAARDVGEGMADAPIESPMSDRFTREFGPSNFLGDETGSASLELLARALAVPAGAAAGAAFDDDHTRGALIGGALGGATMLPGAAQKLERLRYFSMLMGPAQLKNLVGNTGIAVNAAAERALTHGPSAGGKVLKEFFSPKTLQKGIDTFRETEVPLERMDLPASTSSKGITGLPFKLMGAGDVAAQDGLTRGGLADAAKRTFTSDPETAIGQSVMQMQRKGGPLLRTVMPFVKTAVNQAEAGITPLQKLLNGGFKDLPPDQQKQILAKVALLGGSGAAGAAYGSSDFASDHPALSPFAAILSGPGALEFAIAQQFSHAKHTGKNNPQALAAAGSELQHQMPMPSEWAFSPASLLASLIPSGLKDLNKRLDPVDRDTTGSVFGPLLSRIPYLSRMLPPKGGSTRAKYRDE